MKDYRTKENYLKRCIFTLVVSIAAALGGAFAGWHLMLDTWLADPEIRGLNLSQEQLTYVTAFISKIGVWPFLGAILGLLAVLVLLAILQAIGLCLLRTKAPKHNLTAKKRASR